MLRNLLVAIPIMLLCLLFQAGLVGLCARRYVDYRRRHGVPQGLFPQTALLALVMCLAMLGYFLQITVWAAAFRLLGEFADFSTSLYYSAVTFATLGYGDIVLSERWRLLGALEAANGVLMLGVSTAMMTAAVSDLIRRGEPGSIDAT